MVSGDRHVIGIFDDSDKADLAAKRLVDNGFSSSDVSLLVTAEAREKHFEASSKLSKTAEAVGAVGFGSVIGGLIAALTAAAIPGSLFIAGPMTAAIASGAAGAVGGGLAGGLVVLGISENEISLVEHELDKGNIVLATNVHDESHEAAAKQVFKETGAFRVY